jgi:hypothetical protein
MVNGAGMVTSTAPRQSEVWTRFRFAGDLDPEAFGRFMIDRARCLMLNQRSVSLSVSVVECEVAGPVDLLDAFEVACLLGPASALVLEADRELLDADDLRAGRLQ